MLHCEMTATPTLKLFNSLTRQLETFEPRESVVEADVGRGGGGRDGAGIVGRGNAEGARLFRAWFDELGRAQAEGRGISAEDAANA